MATLVGDGNARSRADLRCALERGAQLLIVGEAATPEQAVRLSMQLQPELVTVDLDTWGRACLDAISTIMSQAPTRVVALASQPASSSNPAGFESLCRGAMEILPRPTKWGGQAERCLVEQIRRVAAMPPPPRLARQSEAPARPTLEQARRRVKRPVVCIGGSTGGPRVLKQLLAGLPASFNAPLVVVQHMADVSGAAFVEWLGADTPIGVREACGRCTLRPGVAWVAFRDRHIRIVDGGGLICTTDDPPRQGHRPSVDVLFESAAATCGPRTIGVLLSGMGHDGAQGLEAIASAQGITLAQSAQSSVVFGMARAAIERGAVTRVVDAEHLADELQAWIAPLENGAR